ncbi:pilus assembly FimT family protein [Fimbriiglobus ruber]|uniref:General secretion pathway GspH domain-containing protein n=1 Tax=Fimbriiglobus ruber TaxID=1908690 RepID=A0A225EAT4_9BACT|nr:prepilin-type N-terminal cleavage/methylation domain-containing protein [Fimbriiglobus ruber]OWK45665.1 hypothetical protein FRUB_01996 [Fimbriiglobus ruber]
MTIARRPHQVRRGYTLVELLAVMAISIILGAVSLPTLRAYTRDSKVKAGADTFRARIADARSAAVGQGRAYRVALSPDGSQVKVEPDDLDTVGTTPVDTNDADTPVIIEEGMPEHVTVEPVVDDGTQQVTDQSGWVRVATFLPDGTCREDHAIVRIREPGQSPIAIRIRGLTGTVAHATGQ